MSLYNDNIFKEDFSIVPLICNYIVNFIVSYIHKKSAAKNTALHVPKITEKLISPQRIRFQQAQ